MLAERGEPRGLSLHPNTCWAAQGGRKVKHAGSGRLRGSQVCGGPELAAVQEVDSAQAGWVGSPSDPSPQPRKERPRTRGRGGGSPTLRRGRVLRLLTSDTASVRGVRTSPCTPSLAAFQKPHPAGTQHQFTKSCSQRNCPSLPLDLRPRALLPVPGACSGTGSPSKCS